MRPGMAAEEAAAGALFVSAIALSEAGILRLMAPKSAGRRRYDALDARRELLWDALVRIIDYEESIYKERLQVEIARLWRRQTALFDAEYPRFRQRFGAGVIVLGHRRERELEVAA